MNPTLLAQPPAGSRASRILACFHQPFAVDWKIVSDRQRIRPGELVMVGIPGPELDRATRSFLATHAIGGVVLFRRNVSDGPALARLIADLHALNPRRPLLVGIDHEGGRVHRLDEPF